MDLLSILAQDAGGGGGIFAMLVILGPPLLLLFFLQTVFGRTDAKDRARRNQMISELKKNDRIVTIGGILGSVASVSEDRETVTIKVDENTRLKVQAAAIRSVVNDTEE